MNCYPWWHFDRALNLAKTGLFETPPEDGRGLNIWSQCRLSLKGFSRYSILITVTSDGLKIEWEKFIQGSILPATFDEIFEDLPNSIKEQMIWHLDLLV